VSTASRGFRGKRLRYVAAALLVVLAFTQPTFASTTAQELDQARKKLQTLRRELRPIRDRAIVLHNEVISINTRVSQATVQIEALGQAKEEAEQELEQSRAEAADLQENLNERARDAYIRGPAGALELVLEADSLANLTDRIGFLDVLSSADANVADGLRVERQQIAQFREQLQKYLDEKKKLAARLEADLAVFQAKQEEMAAAKEALVKKVAEASNAVASLQQRYQQELLNQYGISSNIGPPLKADGPFYHCPVDPPRSYIEDFGAPRVGHTHQGNDIFAPEGTPIRAPFDGTAEEGYDGLGGTVVHVYASANADYVYNAHLSRHAGVDGQHVIPGQLIGYVGHTGNAASTPSHDHFEYHPGGGSAVSPYLYLNEVCGVGGIG
jgi:murein DD-endopeptidase MepM/ murein hydrolase activator NlpD